MTHSRRFAVLLAVALFALPLAAQRTRAVSAPSIAPAISSPSDLLPPGLAPCAFVIDLSEAQKAQIRSIVTAAQPQLQSLKGQLTTDRQALAAATSAATPDACAIGSAYLRVDADQKALTTALLALVPQIGAVLTPDQRSKLEGCLAAMQQFGQNP